MSVLQRAIRCGSAESKCKGGVSRVWTTTYARKVWEAETFHSNSNDVMASTVNPSSLFDLDKKTVDEQFLNNARAIMSLKVVPLFCVLYA
ncbi:hypothetical protein J6590_090169 [Homalodisca vitripennis]|nr:hypothetical protein J6590_090169 [Homalodisca vitripennis]